MLLIVHRKINLLRTLLKYSDVNKSLFTEKELIIAKRACELVKEEEIEEIEELIKEIDFKKLLSFLR